MLITDRGSEHARNEDAAAAGMVVDGDTGRPYAVAVAVCDGVSTSGDPQAGFGGRVEGGCRRDAGRTRRGAATARTAVLAGLADAAKAAAAAGTGTDAVERAVVHVHRGDARPAR